MDKENLIKMFKQANSNLSTLNYQINSLNYNPSLNKLNNFFLIFFISPESIRPTPAFLQFFQAAHPKIRARIQEKNTEKASFFAF